MRITESQLRRIIREELSMEENDFTYAAAKAAVAGKKSFKFGGEELSKKTKETLKKKADKRGLTPGSVYAEFKKGLAA